VAINSQVNQLFEFGPYRLDTGERVLTRAGTLVPLTPKALDTLIALVRHSGHVMEKDELLKEIWPDTFVEEATLAQNIFTLRKALGNGQGDGLKYIETIPRRGYRFIAPLRELPYADQAAHTQTAPEPTAPAAPLAVLHIQHGLADEPPSAQSAAQPAAPAERRRAAFLIGAALVGVLALTVFAIFKFSVQRQAQTPARLPAPAQAMKLTRLPINGKVGAADLSPDGKYVAYITEAAGQRSIWIRQTTTTSRPQQVVAPGDFTPVGVNFSRDGVFLYYVALTKEHGDATLFRQPAFGGMTKQISTGLSSRPSFAPDGRHIAFLRSGSAPDKPERLLVITDVEGGGERVLARRAAPAYLGPPAWSPDGETIACPTGSYDPSPGYATITTLRVRDGAEQPLTAQRWYGFGELAWLPDGSGLVAILAEQELSPMQLWQLSYPDGAARRITNDLNSYEGVGLTADATTLLTLQTDVVSNIWIAPAGDEARATQITQGPGKYDGAYGLSWTPDGRLVYASIASGAWDIWRMNADGSGAQQLTIDARSNYGPSVSPDGRYIVFVSNRAGGAFHVWRMNADGSNPVQLTFGDYENFAHVTADGRWVVYASVGYAQPNYIWKVPIDGGQPVRLTDKNSSWPFPAPDGKTFTCIYQPDEHVRSQLAIFSMDGGAPLKLFELPPTFRANTVWSPDGRAIHFLDNRGGVSNVWAQPVDGSAPRQVTDFKTEGVVAYDWARDGRLACARGIETSGVVLIKDFR
jgi:Tol biopolymer transport system component/DNA-binding winged helix-turn-helix (wHTH) protein